jgi:hypothetical protein
MDTILHQFMLLAVSATNGTKPNTNGTRPSNGTRPGNGTNPVARIISPAEMGLDAFSMVIVFPSIAIVYLCALLALVLQIVALA